MIRPQYLTQQLILVNATLHPALQRCTTDNSECDASPGMRCAGHTFYGGPVTCKECVCNEHTYALSGCCTFNELVNGLTPLHGASTNKK